MVAASIAVGISAAAAVSVIAAKTIWRSQTAHLGERLDSRAKGAQNPGRIYQESDLEGLPEPVQRYFRRVLRPGQPLIRRAWHRQSGEFQMGKTKPNWRPLTQTQVQIAQPPGFVWDARISMAPGLSVCVRDGFVDGEASMVARILGILPLVNVSGRSELNEAALQRHLAELCWMPTALLPGQGVVWAPLDTASARATLKSGSVTAALDFHFADSGDLTGVATESRMAAQDGGFVAKPWRTKCLEYAEPAGMRIPVFSEVYWIENGIPAAYWRGRIEQIRYAF